MEAHKAGVVQATIARSADFYGPSASKGVLNMNLIYRILVGKKPRWLGDPNAKHSFAYTLDAARATVMLGLDQASYGEVWHLPVAAPAMTAQEIVAYINKQLGTKLSISVPPSLILSIVGLFNPIVREAARMTYQFDHDYILSCDKFMAARPDFPVTSYQDGLKAALELEHND
jgi:nucleoside-diphosphate-sugar epimerase